MNIKHYIGLAALMLSLTATAQTAIDFETEDGYTKLGVYDSWENSPFRKGTLVGNVRVVANHLTESDPIIGDINPSAHILGFQRSRFASNVFGARIDLTTPFEMSATTRYVHVMIYKQTEGRVMLVGLGKRQDRPNQKPEVEQFNVLSTSPVKAGKWYDAVFPISGTRGVDIHSLVVVPECEPTHDMTADEIVFIDNIEINDSPRTRITYGYYPVNVEKTDVLTRTDRYTNSISLTSPTDGQQTIATNQQTNKLVYNDALAGSFKVKAGETVTPAIGYNSSWMHGYVYLDRDNNGRFDFELNDDLSMPEGCELMAYSGYKDKNSKGETVTANMLNSSAGAQPPSFTVPADLKPGFYRLRYKVDWDNIDPAGNSASGNTITANGGIIVDTRLNVHADEVNLTRGQHAQGTNGEVTTADGKTWPATIPFGEPFTFKVVPSKGFTFSHAIVRHGYNLKSDSLVYETPQYEDVIIPAYAFKDNTYTLPAEYVDGDVQITLVFPSAEGGSTSETDYPLNFDKGLLIDRTADQDERKLTALKIGSTTMTVSNDPLTVYKDMTAKEVGVTPGQTVTVSPTATANYYMHAYLYVDLNQDGQFDTSLNADGTPAVNGEMLSYAYHNGKNSAGETVDRNAANLIRQMPSFKVPELLPPGNYRARFKIDWDDIDPAGHWSEGGSNQINKNGGYVVDFILNVHNEKHPFTVNMENGSVVMYSSPLTGIPEELTPFTAPGSLRAVPASEGYELKKVNIRHGHNLDGPQYIHGNRQWSDYSIEWNSDTAIRLPKDSVNGDVVLTANFEPVGTPDYKLIFADEFDSADGSQPNSKFWTRCTREHPTWKRFMSINDEEHELTGYIENGNFVARCVPNPFKATDNVDMISGGIETSGKFSTLYGKVEARILTRGHSGNFPAFWMMPEDNSAGWPYAGEIDIWEQIDSENKTYHTIHSKWANGTGDGADCQGQGNNPTKSGSVTATTGNYHILTLEWTPTLLTWYVDGQKAFSYAKSTVQDHLDRGQWPFDKPFYIIINQAVGNGSWAANVDTNHTYETLFDWVRVYYSETAVGIDDVTAADGDIDVSTARGTIRIVAPRTTMVNIFDLSGRAVFTGNVQGNRLIAVQHGVYVVNGTKVLVP